MLSLFVIPIIILSKHCLVSTYIAIISLDNFNVEMHNNLYNYLLFSNCIVIGEVGNNVLNKFSVNLFLILQVQNMYIYYIRKCIVV